MSLQGELFSDADWNSDPNPAPRAPTPPPAAPQPVRESPATLACDPALTVEARRLCATLGLGELAQRSEVWWNPRIRSAAGRADYRAARIELNPKLKVLPAPQSTEEIERTFLHELAHLVAYARCGRRRIAPHGPEWRQACADLGIAGEDRCHNLGFGGRTIRRRYAYVCPNCQAVVERVQRVTRKIACYPCCKKDNGGRYDLRFALVERFLG
jgi:predicted SprT family Zn-dependent metalloprotease